MLETKILVTKINKIPSDMTKMLNHLADSGWCPAILESYKSFLQYVGLSGKLPLEMVRSNHNALAALTDEEFIGDIFIKENDWFYIIIPPKDSNLVYRRLLRQYSTDAENNAEELKMEVGIFSFDNEGLYEKLDIFVKYVEEAFRISYDNEQKASSVFAWREVKPGTPQLDKITSNEDEKKTPTYQAAKLVTKEVQAAQVLADKLSRRTLIDIVRARFVQERDLQKDILNKKKELGNVNEAIDKLKKVGLLDAEFLLECKQSSQALTRFKNRQQFDRPEIEDLICPSCHSSFKKERLTEGYSASVLGRKMTAKSYWMTVWVTEQLTKIGIPQEAILWNITDASEEVDLLVEFLTQVWIFELKDREFSSGDAYPLNYRQVLYNADKAIIIATDKVSKDAKKIFQELIRGREQGMSKREPVYIEDLSSAEDILRKEVSNTALRYAKRRLTLIGNSSGYNIDAIFSARFGTNQKEEA